MKTERKRFAEAHRAQGRAEADVIEERAKKAQEQILAFAERKAQRIRAEGLVGAAAQYRKYRKDERLAMLIRELKFLREVLKENTVILGDEWLQHSLKFFREGPSLPPLHEPTAPAPAGKKEDK